MDFIIFMLKGLGGMAMVAFPFWLLCKFFERKDK